VNIRETTDHELVPLADRLRWLRVFRLAVGAAVAGCLIGLPATFAGDPATIAGVTLIYLVASLAAEGGWRLLRRRALPFFSVMLILDGVFVAWLAWGVTEPDSPLRHLVIVHLVAITLLASFRTGLKLSMWHSLLLLTFFHLQSVRIAGETIALDHGAADVEYSWVVGSIAVFWIASIGTATFAAVNERELRRRRFDLEGLARLSNALQDASELPAVARALTAVAAETFGFRRVALLDAGPDDLLLIDHVGATVSGVSERGASALAQHVLEGRRTVFATGVSADEEAWLAQLLPSARSLVIVPLQADAETTLGALICEHGLDAESRVEQRVVSMLERFTFVAAQAMRKVALLEQLQERASTDGLTGVANRRSFDAALGREFALSLRSDAPLSVAMIDLDHFKRLNDTLGHVAGDAVLVEVARELCEASRAADLVARYGGEEFVVLLPGADADTASVVARRLHGAVRRCRATAPLTASVGVATFPDHAIDAVGLVEAADRALYAAKETGRDRVVRAGTPTST
jgi:diguanylate cyclase (GGDEF)-like protein